MSQKRGQVSLEYVILIAFVFLLIIPASFMAYTSYQENRDIIAIRQAEDAAYAIVSEAESVYYLGPPSMSNIVIYLPPEIVDAQVQGYEVTFRVETASGIDDVTAISNVNMTGDLPTQQGRHTIRIEALGSQVELS
jgi:uncharacterized protein (UPF0333 family)